MFIWLGDVTYMDSRDPERSKDPKGYYERRLNDTKNSHWYEKLESSTKIIGVWDDNDYGKNDGGRRYADKFSNRGMWLDFIGEPHDSERRLQSDSPIQQDYFIRRGDLSIHVILLDNRYDSDDDSLLYGTGDVLGEEQWLWLDLALKRGKKQGASVTLIGAGIQMTPERIHVPFIENFRWKNRERLYQTLKVNEAE